MVDDPKTIREVNIRLDGIQSTLNSQITWLRAGIAGCFGLIVAVAGGGFTLFHEIGGVDSKVSALDATVKSATSRIERLDASLSSVPQIQARLEQTTARLETAIKSQTDQIAGLRPLPSLGLTANQYSSLRSAFKLERRSFQPPKYTIGDTVPESELKPLPQFVYDKIAPSLKGMKFVLDDNGSLIIASATNVAIIIVEPA